MKKLTITYKKASGEYNYNGDVRYVQHNIIVPVIQEADGTNTIKITDEALSDLAMILNGNYVQCMLTHKD